MNSLEAMEIREYPMVIYARLGQGNLVYAEFRHAVSVDLATAKAIVASRLEFTQNKMHLLVADMSLVKHMTTEAKEYMQRADGGLKNIVAAALIASNPLAALIANIFVKGPKEFPARFFSRKEDAIQWILALQPETTDLKS
ncbi:MAG: hypothetical protein HC859_08700 [Bacteroidia bacterium]|nr:hypothetical protein [Bacteroidia bacterium]